MHSITNERPSMKGRLLLTLLPLLALGALAMTRMPPAAATAAAEPAAMGMRADGADSSTFENRALATLEEATRRQGEDPEWARDMERAFEALFRGEEAAEHTLHEVRCGSRLCRLSLSHADEDARESLPALFMHELFDRGAQVLFDVEGRTRVYVPRDEGDLPDLR
jgi:hypothetical protein